MITPEQLSIAIAAVVCIIGLCTFIYNRLGDHGKREHWQGQVSAKLDHISDDVKDLKANQRLFERQIIETRELAIKAKSAADKAHERLDKINAPSAYSHDNRQE